MNKNIYVFALQFVVSLIVVFGIHLLVLKQIQYEIDYYHFISAYAINYLLALFIVVILMRYIDRLKAYIGFLFMIGSMLKFAVFFLAFYPAFKADGVMDRVEFTYFFVPYMLSLLFETKKLAGITNNI